jgi:hypothetical protein
VLADDRTPRSSGQGRLLTAAAWVLLLLALWVWAYTLTDGESRPDRSGTGPGAPIARLASDRPRLPPAHDPLGGRPHPERLDMESIGLHAPIVERGTRDAEAAAGHGADGAPPPDPRSGPVRWDSEGPAPGAVGEAVLEGRTGKHGGGRPVPGARLYVSREGGTVAEFTVARVWTVRGHGAGEGGERTGDDGAGARQHAGLRLHLCRNAGSGPAVRGRTCDVRTVVSAYLTGSRPA